jgi:hypothetical protein
LMNRCLGRSVHPWVRILSGYSMDIQRGKVWRDSGTGTLD